MKKKLVIIGVVVVLILLLVWMWQRSRKTTTPPVTILKQEDAVETMQYRYTAYSSKAFGGAAKKKRVYFFSSATCTTCDTVRGEFLKQSRDIPEDIVIFDTDMESNNAIVMRYSVTAPHAFVQVDDTGKIVSYWSSGGIKELKEHIK